ncbi:UNVERIFIED_CONTAM: hypothetical protein Sradi_2993800 [Sesamum radiatum]|uniref:Uncharacterized protein n=1 Tax=Sesamum radiatum TaxID=300843 RepID=A0AAW2S1K6_SESRA
MRGEVARLQGEREEVTRQGERLHNGAREQLLDGAREWLCNGISTYAVREKRK